MTDNSFPRFDLQGQVALVTGAARGIGRACALALAHAGADIALGLRDIQTGGELAREIEAMGRRALPLQMDVIQLDQVRQAVTDAAAHFGRLDILVNNAGLGPSNLPEDVREEDFDYTVAVNIKGTFFVSQAAGKVMIKQNYGRIINLSSQAGFVALPTESVYCLTKAAINHLTRCLAVEWGKYNITVNAICPGFFPSKMTAGLLAVLGEDRLAAAAPLKRLGDDEDLKGLCVLFASDAGKHITGQWLAVDGGVSALIGG